MVCVGGGGIQLSRKHVAYFSLIRLYCLKFLSIFHFSRPNYHSMYWIGLFISNSSAFRSRFNFSVRSDSPQSYPVIMHFTCLCRCLLDRKFPLTPENGCHKQPLWFLHGLLAKWNWFKGQKPLLFQCLNCPIEVVVWQVCANLFKGQICILKVLLRLSDWVCDDSQRDTFNLWVQTLCQ